MLKKRKISFGGCISQHTTDASLGILQQSHGKRIKLLGNTLKPNKLYKDIATSYLCDSTMDIEVKRCTTCNDLKWIDELVHRNGKPEGQCKECRAKYIKKYRQDMESGKREKVQEPIVVNGMKQCRICSTTKPLTDFPIRNNSRHGYRHECKPCKAKRLRQYHQDTYNEVRRDRRKTDVCFRLLCNHRLYVYKCLTQFGLKCESSIKYIGCSVKQLKEWLEFLFEPGMNWENYGTYWTVDHVIPLSLFDFTKIESKNIAFNWKNMQPSKDNFQKSNKIRLWEFFNVLVSAHRFINQNSLCKSEYQGINASLCWLRNHLRYGNNLMDDSASNLVEEMGNPQPRSQDCAKQTCDKAQRLNGSWCESHVTQ